MDVTRTTAVAAGVNDSLAYLASDAALRSLETDTYWPKWHSPWWHMLLLHELGETRRIPEGAIASMVEGLNRLALKTFPIRPEDLPPGADEYRDTSCHCAVGTMYQVLATFGVDVDRAVPWMPPWLVHYQLPDGGHNCEGSAYLAGEPDASSMVATVPLFEALLARRQWNTDEHAVAERAAAFLIARELRHGSRSQHNASEREVAPSWLAPCFPRFYFYDVLRGLAVLVRWIEREGRPLSIASPGSAGARSTPEGSAELIDAITPVVEHLVTTFPDGIVRVQRHAHGGRRTLAQRDGVWVREPTTSSFPLLEAASTLGAPSEALTRQWSATRRALVGLL